jgi:hypothetical protein
MPDGHSEARRNKSEDDITTEVLAQWTHNATGRIGARS